MFQPSWEWNKGGKLPGAFGGTGSNAFGCSGGRQEGRDTCFGARLMWRADGKGELYTYLPLTDENREAQMQVPGTVLNDDYGFSVGRGSFTFTAGEWITVAEVRVLIGSLSLSVTVLNSVCLPLYHKQRVKLSSPSANDGIIQVFVNGQLVIDLQNVQIPGPIQGYQFQTFFGGSTSDYASPQDQKAWFADVSGAVIEGGGSNTSSIANTGNATTAS